MSLRKYANKRDNNETSIIKALTGVGATVWQLDQPCDLLVGFRGVNTLMDVKDKGGTLTKDQVLFHEYWRGQIAIVWNPDDALRAIGAIQ
jgi:hypothetical protein